MKVIGTNNLFEVAQIAYKNNDFKRAFSTINKLKRSGVNLTVNQILLDAQINIALKKYDKALIILKHGQQRESSKGQSVSIHNAFVKIYTILEQGNNSLYHLEQIYVIDCTLANVNAFLALLDRYISTQQMVKAKEVAQRLLAWNESYIRAALAMLKIAIFERDEKAIIQFSQALQNHLVYLDDEQVYFIFVQLIKSELLEQARSLLDRDHQSRGERLYHQTGTAILKLRVGNLQAALQLIKEVDYKFGPFFLDFYLELLEYYFKRNEEDKFFALVTEFTDIQFLLVYIQTYISHGELEQLTAKTDNYLTISDNSEYAFGLDCERLIAFFLLGNIENCQAIIKKYNISSNASIDNQLLQAPLRFFKLIKALVNHNEKHKNLISCDATEALYVIGESHSLVLNNKIFRCHDIKYQATSNFIKGIQMHNLNDEVNNQYCSYVNQHIKKTPVNANLFFTIGEIDCRIDGGISQAAVKLNEPLEKIINKTVNNYIDYIEHALRHKKVKTVFIQGIPAPNNKKLAGLNYDKHIQVIQQVNHELQESTLAKNWVFIDVYSATKDQDGWSNGKWHIDNIHLKPSIYDDISRWAITSN
ncbi:MAG: hypothetical protein HRT52_17755 [Colwellia sp.]|nr:hypothetical protein [Colwellia sp.]